MGTQLIHKNKINPAFSWFNEPQYRIGGDALRIVTSPRTDFWQKTHYGFSRDNGHGLLATVLTDFSMTVKTGFTPNEQYDQCGLMVRLDAENWIKMSVEYENEEYSRLGSVVTNLGYSDWATIDISSSVRQMHYRIRSMGSDFLLEYSETGEEWNQLRIAHLHQEFGEIGAGIYACSPGDGGFEAEFDSFQLEEKQ